jgi:hypothetical protein
MGSSEGRKAHVIFLEGCSAPYQEFLFASRHIAYVSANAGADTPAKMLSRTGDVDWIVVASICFLVLPDTRYREVVRTHRQQKTRVILACY